MQELTMTHSVPHWLWVSCGVFFLLTTLAADSQTIHAVKFQHPPLIDGRLDDSCWQQATAIYDFKIAELDTTIKDKTEAYLGIDEEALYVGFRCFQEEPSLIVSQTRRDGTFQYEDHVAVYLDTYHDQRTTYHFAVNPLGTQLDEKHGDLSWDGRWLAAAIIEPSVWTIELKIPFHSLQFPSDVSQTWGLNLVRRHQSLEKTSTWADTGVNVSDANRFGRLTDLKFNQKQWGKKTLLGGYFSAKSEDFSTKLTADVGGDIAYQLTTSTSLIGTVNPDFSHIESEIQGIVLSDLEQRLTDRRPFFQEDGQIFRTPISLFYSRRIGEMDYGAKLIGKTGRTTYGLMDVFEKSDESHNVLLRGLWDTVNSSSLGLFLASKEMPGEYNRSVALDGSFRLPQDLTLLATYAGNWELQQGNRHALFAALEHTGLLTFSLAYREVEAGFNPVNGFVPLKDIRQPSLWGRYRWPVEKGFLQNLNVEVVESQTWNHAGEKTRRDQFRMVSFDFRGKMQAGVFYRNWFNESYENGVIAAQVLYNRQSPDHLLVIYQDGDFEGSKATFITTAINLIPFRFLSIGIKGENLLRSFPDGRKTHAFSVRASVNFEMGTEKWMTFRMRDTKDHKPNLNAVLKYALTENLVLYLVYGDQDADQTVNQLFTKISANW
jgi:hypothetical protein